ncbi:MAG: MMPL family transporter [bacterium]|nr:MMPL family transporter [bacterium]
MIRRALGDPVIIIVLIISLSLLGLVVSSGRYPTSTGDVSVLFPSFSRTLTSLQKSNALFGKTQVDVVVVRMRSEGEKELDAEKEVDIYTLEEELAGLDGIVSLMSPLQGLAKVPPPWQLISEDGQWGRFVLEVSGDLSEDEAEKLNHEIDHLLAEYRSLQPLRDGSFFLTQSVTREIEHESKKIIPYSIATLFGVLLLMFRNPVLALISFVTPMVVLAWFHAIIALLKFPLDPVSQLCPPFLLAVSTAYSIHITARLAQKGDVKAVPMGEINQGLFFAVLTTVVGVLSLVLLDVKGVTDFAVMSGFGIFVAGVICSQLNPALVNIFHVTNQKKSVLPIVLRKVILRGRGAPGVVFSLIGLTMMIFSGVSGVQVHTDPQSFLPRNSHAYRQVMAARQHFAGNLVLGVYFQRKAGVRTKGSKDVLHLEDIALIEKVKSELRKLKGVEHTVSAGDFIDLYREMSQIRLDDAESESWGPGSITNNERTATRIIIDTDLEGRKLLELRNAIKLLLQDELKQSSLDARIASLGLLVAEQSNHIVRGIINSLISSLLIVFILLLAGWKSIRIALIGLVPNVIPVIIVFGSLGWLYGEINLGSALVAVTALSIAVDNTFHLLMSWKAADVGGPQIARAERRALRQNLDSFINSSVVLIAGFTVMAFSAVAPVAQFGLLLSIALLVGAIADMYVLPYLLRRFA